MTQQPRFHYRRRFDGSYSVFSPTGYPIARDFCETRVFWLVFNLNTRGK